MKLFVLAAAALLAAAPAGHATNIIDWAGPGTDQIHGVNDGAGHTTITGVNVDISINQILGGPATPFSAILNLSASSIDNAVSIGGEIIQHYSGSFSITSGSGGSGTNYLSGSFTDGTFGTGPSLTMSAGAPPDSITFSSDVIPLLAMPSSISFAFTNVTPDLSILNNSIADFAASHSGTASASAAVPEPASLGLLGAGILGLAAFTRRRSKV